MVLRNFERRLEHLVEGTFARVFKTGLNPIEIGRRIVREIDANQSVAVDGALALPIYWVYISTADYERFQEVETPLTNELIEAARTHIADENYRVLGPVSVVLVEAAEYPEGTLQVQAQWREGATTPTTAALVMETGERFTIDDGPSLCMIARCVSSLSVFDLHELSGGDMGHRSSRLIIPRHSAPSLVVTRRCLS